MTRKMKDSGVEWIGEIPEDWDVIKMKRLFRILNGKEIKNELNTDNKNAIKVYGSGGVFKYTDEFLYNKESILFGRKGTIGKPLIVEGEFWTVDTMYYTEIIYGNLKFLYYTLKAFPWEIITTQTALPSITSTDLLNKYVSVPKLKEQKDIADFLDKKTREIDRIISKTKKAIEEYKKYKQSLITETVTKGLDKNVQMKDSGIEWIGEIPEHWDVVRGKNILKKLDREVLFSDEVITCFRDGEVTLRKNRREDGFTIATKEIGYQGIGIGDLVVHGMDGFAGAIGISDSRGKGSPVLNVLDTKIDNKVYLMHYLRMLASKDVFLALSTGIRERSTDLRWNKLADLDFILPTLKEQEEIATYLDKKTDQIHQIISTKEKLIAEMEAYKKSLIYETVTGKREVE